ncbi:MAG: hypothetical protein ACTHJR_12320 [Sphingomonas sp.]
MRRAYVYHRLRKYARKKFKRSDPKALKYWRYWHKMYGHHVNLWEQII